MPLSSFRHKLAAEMLAFGVGFGIVNEEWNYLIFKEQALSSGGEMRSRLQERVEEADLTLTLQGRAGKTAKWAEANIERAEALVALAAQEEGGDAFSCYDQAIDAYEQALEVYTPDSYLGEWGGVIVSLVRALRTYAAREGGHMGLLRLARGKKLLDTVIAAMPQRRGQFDRAMLMIEQAHIYRARCEIDQLGKRVSHLHDAIACFEEAARILRIKENFDNWATAIIGQACAWREVAALEEDQSDILSALLRSVELFRAVANYYSPERGLDDWVFCHFEQGRTLLRLARYVGGEACRQAAEEAVVCFKKALEHIRQEYTPELWMRCHIDMAFSFIKLEAFADRRQLVNLIEEEIAIFRMAHDYYGAQAETATFCVMASSLGQKLLQLADLKGAEEGRHLRMQALEALRHSVCDELKNQAPDDWLSHIVDLGIALHNVAVHQDSRQRGELSDEAVRVYRRALQYIDEQNNDNASALLRNRLGRLLTLLGEDDDSQEGLMRLNEAYSCFRHAARHYDATIQQEEKGQSTSLSSSEHADKIVLDLVRFKNNFACLLYILAQRTDDAQAQDHLTQALSLLSHVMELVRTRCATSEWYEAYTLYGRVSKHRLQRGFIEDRPAECELAAAVLREALQQVENGNVVAGDQEHQNERQGNANKLSRLILCRHLADIVYMWGRMLPKAAARPLFDEVHALIVQLHDWAEQLGLDDVVQSSRQELATIEEIQDSCRPGWMWRRLWSWFRSLKIRWA